MLCVCLSVSLLWWHMAPVRQRESGGRKTLRWVELKTSDAWLRGPGSSSRRLLMLSVCTFFEWGHVSVIWGASRDCGGQFQLCECLEKLYKATKTTSSPKKCKQLVALLIFVIWRFTLQKPFLFLYRLSSEWKVTKSERHFLPFSDPHLPDWIGYNEHWTGMALTHWSQRDNRLPQQRRHSKPQCSQTFTNLLPMGQLCLPCSHMAKSDTTPEDIRA